MSNRPDTEPGLGIPQEVIREITDRIETFRHDRTPMTDDEVAAALLGFEEQLLELNSALRDTTNGNISICREECAATKEAVVELNLEINVAARGNV